ncbi:DUF6082 family protein [Streptomyces sp. 8N114]|uniref:DUF6082 family protein n=1 Tax=Streptomyces sp. 8N114 TaxID=3457419 RepID=UPI003FD23E93
MRAAAPGGLDWAYLSDVVQVYGFLSMFVSAAALAGVALSLVLQARQTQAAQEESSWAGYRELVFRSLEDPSVAVCWEPPTVPRSREEWKQIAYTNLIVTGWDKAFRLGRITSDQLAIVLRQHFRGELARRHWAAAREDWLAIAKTARSRRTRRFATIVDTEYYAALRTGPAVAPEDYFPQTG